MKLNELTEDLIDNDVLTQIKNSDDNYVVILIGPPASGKSYTTARIKELRDDVMTCSTDDFFMKGDKYVFDVSKLFSNHQKNFQKAVDAMKKGYSVVVVDNTNIAVDDFKHYVRAANTHKYKVLFKIFNVDRETLVKRTIKRKEETGKDVPVEVIDRMLVRMEQNIKSVKDFINKYNKGQYQFVLEDEELKKKIVYVGIFFKPEQIAELNKKFSLNIRATKAIANPHITLFYNKLKNFTNLIKDDIEFGKVVNVYVDRYLVEPSTGHSVFICEIDEPIKTESKPHITVVVGEGKKPYYSNEMINKYRSSNAKMVSINQMIKGTVGYFDGNEVKFK